MFDYFFQLSPIPSNAMSGNYIPSLVLLSYIMACLASYVALDIASTLRQEQTKSNKWLLFGGSFAMGAGIFTMHFIGMLAFVMPMKMEYDLGGTLFSLLVAIVASGFAFFLIKKQNIGLGRLIFGGVILGIAIASMHYTGMASMLHVHIRYLPDLFFLSIVIAIVASIAALWAMLKCETLKKISHKRLFKIGSALVMGIAICGMHYTGMAAAIFHPIHHDSIEQSISFLLSPQKLAMLVAYIASLIMIVTLLFNSYRHLILVKLLMGYFTIILLTIPLAFLAIEIFNSINHSFGEIQNVSDLANFQEQFQIFSQEMFFIYFLVLGSIFLFSVLLSVFLAMQFSNPIALLRNSAQSVAKGDLKQHVNISSNDEIGQLANSFNHMVEALAESKKEEEKFMSLAAHDLKHPLSVILQASSVAESEIQEKKTDNLEKLNQMIHRASTNMAGLIDELLTLHHCQAITFQITLEKINIKQFAQNIYEFNQLIAQKKDINFNIYLETEKDEYKFDGNKIEQVINNLLSNAFKFSIFKKNVKLIIKGNQSTLRIEVHDEAGGIPIEEQNKVFTRFAQISVKPTDGESSHGLGLAICQDIIVAHGGKIGFESIPGKGSVFYFEINDKS